MTEVTVMLRLNQLSSCQFLSFIWNSYLGGEGHNSSPLYIFIPPQHFPPKANVMLEYDIDEAQALLEKNLSTASRNLETLEDDLDFLRDQFTTTEVSILPACSPHRSASLRIQSDRRLLHFSGARVCDDLQWCNEAGLRHHMKMHHWFLWWHSELNALQTDKTQAN